METEKRMLKRVLTGRQVQVLDACVLGTAQVLEIINDGAIEGWR